MEKQEIPTLFDEEQELLQTNEKESNSQENNINSERDFQKEFDEVANKAKDLEKDFAFGSANHQEHIEKENIKDIENSDFYKNDAYDKVEQFIYYEEQVNKELDENLKRQKEVQEELKRQNNANTNQQENEEVNKFTKENINPKDKEDLEKELRNLKIREKEIQNDLNEKRRESTNDLVKTLNAKDINELITLLVKIYQRRKEKKVIKERLKDNKESQTLNKEELKALLKLEQIAKDLSTLVKKEENKELLMQVSGDIVKTRKESKDNVIDINQNKELSKDFSKLMDSFKKTNDIKKQEEILNKFENLYEKMQKHNPTFKDTHQEQSKKIDEFLNKYVKNKEHTKTQSILKKTVNTFGRAM